MMEFAVLLGTDCWGWDWSAWWDAAAALQRSASFLQKKETLNPN